MALSEIGRRIRAFLDSDRSQADEELQRRLYTYAVADLDGIYYDEISGWPNRAWGSGFTPAVAGQLSYVQLLNPTNSGVDIVPDLILISASAAQIIEIRIGAGIGTSVTSSGRRDTRAAGQTLGNVRTGTEAAASGAIRARIRALANTPIILPIADMCCLGSAIGIHVEGTVVNTDVEATWFWREFQPGRNRSS